MIWTDDIGGNQCLLEMVVSKVYKFNQRVESPLWKCFCIFNWQFQSSGQSDWFNWSRKFEEERDFELVVSHFHKITYTYLNHSHIWILFIVVDEVRCNQAPLLGKQRKLHLKKRYANKCEYRPRITESMLNHTFFKIPEILFKI